MADEFGEKTEEATEHRRREAREQGNVARSADLTSAGHMFAAAAVLLLFGTPLRNTLSDLMAGYLAAPKWSQLGRIEVAAEFESLLSILTAALLPPLLLLLGLALFFNFVQVGFQVTPSALQPKASRINPLSGAKRIFSIAAVVRLGASLAKLAAVVALAAWFMLEVLPAFVTVTQLKGSEFEPGAFLAYVQDVLVELSFFLAISLLILALLDYWFQKWKYEQDLRMTKQEIREEMKQMDGDPQMRQRRQEAHRKLADGRELRAVPDADVVLANPTHFSVAIKYDPTKMPAPVVVAKGQDEKALRIREIARQHNVPIVERPQLARALYANVRVGEAIPVDMYEVFAEIMAYVYRLAGRTPPAA